jgi:UDP-N-acetylglucosamine diphosphorylase / glucose-1-phosphate thymidylyltransferase / UDP-N-acetylgalactosamine diphosphorylase / glucosamine-1-phosphate N-acetyltransferase / galactosamine-1-phosphate N-acetyltransferase
MQAVMLLAGEGTRMHPLTYTKPKPLLKIAGQTILEHNLENLKRNGIQDVTLIVGYLQEEIKKFLENVREFKFNFVLQGEQLGTGHALLQAKDFIKDDNFTVIYGDDLYHYEDIKKTLNNDLCVTAKEVTNPEKFGVFTLENNFVKGLIEKPDEPISNLANTGLYILNKNIFKSLQTLEKSQRNEFELTDAILHLSKEHSIKCEITNKWIPIGYPWDLVTANEIKMQDLDSINLHVTAFVGKNATIEGSVKIGRNSKIKNGAYIEGPVMIGDNCIIGPNCYLRPNSVIGDNCRIGNGVEVKNTIVGDGTKIEHLTYVGDSVIGDNCNLAAGTKISNLRHDNKTIRVTVKDNKIDTGRRKFGVVMGDHTKTGVNTSIYPGVLIGPFSWTSPAVSIKENIRPLTLDGNKILNEAKFDAGLVEKIKFVQSML